MVSACGIREFMATENTESTDLRPAQPIFGFFIWEHDFLIEKQTSGIGGLGFRVFRGFRGYLIDACVGGFKIWSIALG